MECGGGIADGVYPRVGGGAAVSASRNIRREGLSPRGRGSRFNSQLLQVVFRSIPAWAGEPTSRGFRPQAERVYPRVGGGAFLDIRKKPVAKGLSPRGRGSHRMRPGHLTARGSIPAWAGEPGLPHGGRAVLWVYPRVGGGA